MRIGGEGRGAHWTGRWAGPARSAGLRGQTQDRTGRRDVGGRGGGQEAGVGARERDGQPRGLEKAGAQGCWGRGAECQAAGAGKPPSRRPGGLGVALKFGAGGPRSKKANVGRGRARHVRDTGAE